MYRSEVMIKTFIFYIVILFVVINCITLLSKIGRPSKIRQGTLTYACVIFSNQLLISMNYIGMSKLANNNGGNLQRDVLKV